jgi:hypothetical protein
MSGPMRSGLIFGLTALVLVLAVSWIPAIGVLLVAPLVVLGLATAAGYLAVRWGAPAARIGGATMAGALTGVGALVGSMLFFIIAISLVRWITPNFEQEIIEEFRAEQPDITITPEQVGAILTVAMPLAGFCVGLVELLLALGFGALGGWLALRNQAPAPPPPPMAPPPLAPSDEARG